jgi:predicted dehydrogenase
MKKVRWGILGAGRIARQFAADIRFAPTAELHAVGARQGSRAISFAREFGIPAAHASYEALLSDPDVDAIYVATPHSFHLEQSLAAMRAGKAVLCEKPLTTSPDDCRALARAAHDQDTFLMEALWTAFLPSIQKAREWLDDGRIGELVQLRADFGFSAAFNPRDRLWNPALAGGALLDIGIYPIAFNRLMLGRGPDHISSILKMASTGVDEEVFTMFQTGDITSLLSCSFKCNLDNTGVLIGTRGRIVLPDFWRSTSAFLYEDGSLIESFDDQRRGNGFEFEIEAASRDILDGRKQSETVPLSLSLALQEDMADVISAGDTARAG